MKKYKYIDKMGEISGFGGGYETTCRKMVVAGMKWIDKNSEAKPEFSEYKHIYGIIEANNKEAKELTNVMSKASDNNCSGAQMQACVNHVLYIVKSGWEKYVEKMSNKKGGY